MMRGKAIAILRMLVIFSMLILSACFEEEYYGPGRGPSYGHAYGYRYESPWHEHEEEEHEEHVEHEHGDDD